ncbi:MAG: hypothetical protein A3F75_11520 [Betaproteobacteria bacterium RIFCSPLOWO2_12_FULL_64_23]|nr:MAG: hypothetical protein A3F75_11520 [Betaproteobacteria bacterium RIFCSPLOWO2_12_FULL_64_23]
MLLKLLVLVGFAIYFFNAGERGLTFLALAAIILGIGLFLAALLAIILVIKTWYGSAAILVGLIIFNLVGNAMLAKKDVPPPENPS